MIEGWDLWEENEKLKIPELVVSYQYFKENYELITIDLTLICIKWVPVDTSPLVLATIFTQKMPESSGFMYSSILMLENI